MKPDQTLERMFREEFHGSTHNLIWQNTAGEYEAFGRYRIVPERPGYRVFCDDTEIGQFHSTRTALSWCIADKNRYYERAQELLNIDHKLSTLTQDIAVRAALGDRSRDPQLRETILVKLETKIIHKKQLENRLANCVNWAKYYQQRGFENETARTGRGQSKKTNRQGL